MSAAATPHPHYRPELDGLRAIAVLAVMVFHLHAAWLPGGFAGVDVFFVLSGFLVTSVILRGRAKGHFSYAQFYQRRIARIFPAYLTMAVATLAAAGMTYSSWDFASAASAFSASLLSISNYYQLSLGNYFQLSPDSQPLWHCWSLSVEEQFYLIFPLLLALLFRTPPRARRPLLILILLASFSHSCRLTLSQPVPGFYLLTSRAWEMLAGSLLAFPGSNPSAFQRPPATTMPGWTAGFPGIIASLGMGLVLLSFFVLNEHQPFPGWRALLPVLGTAAIIRGASGGWLHQLLSVRPMVLIGQMSYSLYLWHWPVYSIIDHSLPYQNPGVRLALKIMFTVLGAGACHLLIEKPARRFFNLPRHRLIAFLLLGTALILFVPLGHRLSARHYLDASTTSSGILTFPSPGATRTLMLIGDSQGTMYGQLARDLATAHGLNLVIVSKAGEDPLASPSEPQSELHRRTLETVRQIRPDIVILACHWIYKLQANPERLALTLHALQTHTRRIILLTQPPLLPPSAERSAIRAGSRPPFLEAAADRDLRQQCNNSVKKMSGSGIDVLDIDPLFTNPDGGILTITPAGRDVFHDKVHLSTDGAALLTPLLDPLLTPPQSAAPLSLP